MHEPVPALHVFCARNVSFSTILRVAAHHAWIRSTSTSPSPSPSPTHHGFPPSSSSVPACSSSKVHSEQDFPCTRGKLAPTSPTCRAQSATTQNHRSDAEALRGVPVEYLDPEEIQDSDMDAVDPSRTLPNFRDDYLPIDAVMACIATPVSVSPIRSSRFIPLSSSINALYQRLLALITYHKPLPSLPSLLGYHDRHPGLRSARSYNLLISFAMRNGAYGTVEWLFRSMAADGIQENLESLKLKVRWLVQTGRWDEAWKQVSPNASVIQDGIGDGRITEIPLPVWLEFFRTLKRGTLRRPTTCHPVNSASEIIQEVRYRALLRYRPALTAQKLASSSSRAVHSIVASLFESGRRKAAMIFTTAYFRNLPPKIPISCAKTCLDIIHLHIVFGSPHRGLQKFYESRRTLISLLHIHPSLRPTSTTLFLLLAPLKHAKHCGTVAYKVLRAFKKQWGLRVQDRRVRRRVMAFALKEGREDIIDEFMKTEWTFRWARASWKLISSATGEVGPSCRRLVRAPAKNVFKHNGREERHWCALLKRIDRMKKYRLPRSRLESLSQRHGAVKRQMSFVQGSSV